MEDCPPPLEPLARDQRRSVATIEELNQSSNQPTNQPRLVALHWRQPNARARQSNNHHCNHVEITSSQDGLHSQFTVLYGERIPPFCNSTNEHSAESPGKKIKVSKSEPTNPHKGSCRCCCNWGYCSDGRMSRCLSVHNTIHSIPSTSARCPFLKGKMVSFQEENPKKRR